MDSVYKQVRAAYAMGVVSLIKYVHRTRYRPYMVTVSRDELVQRALLAVDPTLPDVQHRLWLLGYGINDEN